MRVRDGLPPTHRGNGRYYSVGIIERAKVHVKGLYPVGPTPCPLRTLVPPSSSATNVAQGWFLMSAVDPKRTLGHSTAFRHTVLARSAIDPEPVQLVRTWEALGLSARDDAMTQQVAKKISELAKRGLKNPRALHSARIKEFGKYPRPPLPSRDNVPIAGRVRGMRQISSGKA